VTHRLIKLTTCLGITTGLAVAGLPQVTQAQTARPAQPQQAGSALPNEALVRLAGSSTIGGTLMVELASLWAKKIGLPGVYIEAGLDADEFDVFAVRSESTRKMRVQVRAKGSATGIEPLLRGQTDIWMSSRPVQESDLEAMRRANVPNVPTLAQFRTPGVENVIGLDALAIVLNGRNPVRQLSMAQIRNIYAGKVTNWSEVGGPNLPIAIYTPDVAFGANQAFCTTIMNMPDVQRCLDGFTKLAAPRFNLMEEMADAVATNPGGLAFTSLALRRNTRPVRLGTECGNGIEPNSFRIKADEYPLGRQLFMYLNPSQAPNPATREFLQFVLGPEGQTAVAAAGFADLAPGRAPDTYSTERLEAVRDAQDGGRVRVRPNDTRAFEEATAAASRLSITFRFQAGTNSLDSRAEADLSRLGELLKLPAYERSQVILIGFSGSVGDYSENRTLSRERAEAIRDRLVSNYGVKDISATGIGPAAAVACNLDPATASLNQRVEVWLRKPVGG